MTKQMYGKLLESMLTAYYEKREIIYESDTNEWYSRLKCGYLTPSELEDECMKVISDMSNAYLATMQEDTGTGELLKVKHQMSYISKLSDQDLLNKLEDIPPTIKEDYVTYVYGGQCDNPIVKEIKTGGVVNNEIYDLYMDEVRLRGL